MKIEELDKNEALRYLGGGSPNGEMYDMLCRCEKRLLKTLTPRYVYAVYPTETSSQGVKLTGSSVTLLGKDIAAHLAGCNKALLLCVTAGQQTDRLIRALEAENIAEAAVTDSLASVAAERICDLAQQEIFSAFPNIYGTDRYSPGYGDLPLELQPAILELCDAQRKIGLHATDSLLLTPRKSVTAIIGLSDSPIPKKDRAQSCESCPAAQSCTIRKNGGHC